MRIAVKLRSQRTLPVGKSNQDQKKLDLRQPKCLDGGEDCGKIILQKLHLYKMQKAKERL